MGVEFEWDANKSRANLAKHGITFEDAVAVFDDPRVLHAMEGGHPVSA